MSKKSGRKVLRVGLIQNHKILEERLLRSPETVTIGHDYKKNTLVVPASNLPRRFPVFKWDGEAYHLQFTDEMEGRVSQGGRVQTFNELQDSERVERDGDVYRMRLTPAMRGRVSIGEATVLFQFVTPPPERAKPVLPSSMRGGIVQGIEGPLAVLILISALIQVGFVVYLEMQDWPVPETAQVEAQDRMAEIIGEDEPDIEEEEDDGDEPEEEEEDEEAEETEPAEPEEEPEPEEEMTPEEIAEERQDERMEVTERVEDATVLDTLTADGDEEGVIEEMTAGAEVDADEVFDGATRVETDSGLGADRLGAADGGSPDATGEGGLAEGEEMDEIGEDADVETGDRQEQQVETVDVDVQEQRPEDTGELDTDRLMRALQRLRNNVEACYENHLRQNPQARGSVRILITISERGSRGQISSAEVAVDEVSGDQSVGNCIAQELETGRVGRLPPPEGGDARITIPYHFSPGG